MDEMQVIDPKENKEAAEPNAKECCEKVNELMKKYNCRFSVVTIIEDNLIRNQVLIKEIVEEPEKIN